MTLFTVQKIAYIGRETCWYDVSETFQYRPSAEACLKRFQEDLPFEDFRISEFTCQPKRRNAK